MPPTAGCRWFDWLTPFSVFTGFALISGYALLGACFLIMKTEGPLQERMYRHALPLGVAVFGAIVAVSIWTPFLDPALAARWFSWPNVVLLSPVPLLVLVIGFEFFRSLAAGRQVLPFVMASLIFLVSYCGVAISVYPFIVPRAVTVWQAAAPDESLAFLLVGTAILLPVILAYTGYSYWVFRGKVGGERTYG